MAFAWNSIALILLLLLSLPSEGAVFFYNVTGRYMQEDYDYVQVLIGSNLNEAIDIYNNHTSSAGKFNESPWSFTKLKECTTAGWFALITLYGPDPSSFRGRKYVFGCGVKTSRVDALRAAFQACRRLYPQQCSDATPMDALSAYDDGRSHHFESGTFWMTDRMGEQAIFCQSDKNESIINKKECGW
jgi:hypothetical protein